MPDGCFAYTRPAVPPHEPGRLNCPHNEIIAFRRMGAQGKLTEAMARLEALERSIAAPPPPHSGGGGGGGGGGSSSSSSSSSFSSSSSSSSSSRSAAAAPGALGAFTCAICMDTCTDPAATPCGHAFCADHLRAWIREQAASGAAPGCPRCRAPIQASPDSVRPNPDMRAAIASALLQRLTGTGAAAAGAAAPSASASAAPAAPAPPPAPVPRIAYEALAFQRSRRGERVPLAQGAAATLYTATLAEEAVVVKALRLPPGSAPAHQERAFLQEASLRFCVRHECLVPLLGVCVDVEAEPVEYSLVMPRYRCSLEAVLAGSVSVGSGSSSGSGGGGGGGGGGSSSGAGGGGGERSSSISGKKRTRGSSSSSSSSSSASASSEGAPAPAPAAAALLPLPQRLAWLLSIARALRYLHAQGIVHGSVSPAAVLLDAGGRAALCGFSAPLSLGAAAAGGGGGGGGAAAARYTDPAVASGRSALRKASDVYSFGVLAWQVVAGRLPYEGLDAAGIAAYSSGTPEGGRPALAAVPPALQPLIAQCWLDAQADRPSASRVCAALEGAAAALGGAGSA